MKTIKFEIAVYGRLNEDDTDSFDSCRESMTVECADEVDQLSINFLESCFQDVAGKALKNWKEKRKDFQNA